jgi:drug/metabolite transporter (DMT)-like permease
VGAIAAALAASLSWGVCDFLAGMASRKTPVLTVLRVSGVVGLCAIAAVVLVRGRPAPDAGFALWGVAAGVLFAGAIGGFYRAMAVTQMARVAPIVAAAPAIPALFGHLQGDLLSAAQAVGLTLTILGVAVAASERRSGEAGASRAGILLALGATACFGVGIIALDEASADDPFWAALALRAATTVTVVALAIALRRYVRAPQDSLPALWVVGLLDIAGVCLFAVAAQEGPIAIVAAASGLVPLVIILLARVVLDERLSGIRYLGAATAVVGVALVSGG